jgi:hypothetical protein
MRLDWIILHPAGPYAVLAVGMSLCLYLFVSLKREMRIGEQRWRRKVSALEAELEGKAAVFERRLAELSEISGLLVPPEPPRSGLNLTKRSQALHMHRRGASPREIAEALALPQNEIDLLVRVQGIVLSSLSPPGARRAGV